MMRLVTRGDTLHALIHQLNSIRVNALAWDSANSILYIGGIFNTIDGIPASPGIAMWSEKTGLLPFPGGGVTLSSDFKSNDTGRSNSSGNFIDGKVSALAFEPSSQSLFVAGTFHFVDGKECSTIAVWEMSTNKWTCLYDPIHGISSVTTMLFKNDMLYLAGWAAPSSSWDSRVNLAPYAIATLDMSRWIEERSKSHVTKEPTSGPSNISTNSSSSSGADDTPPRSRETRALRRQELVTIHPRNIPLPLDWRRYRRRLHHVHIREVNGSVLRRLPTLNRRRLRRLLMNTATKPNVTFAPSISPTKGPWVMSWAWLPSFPVSFLYSIAFAN